MCSKLPVCWIYWWAIRACQPVSISLSVIPLLSFPRSFHPSSLPRSLSLSPGPTAAQAEHLALNGKWGLRQIHAPLEPVGCSDTCLAHLILNRLKDHVKRNYTVPESSTRPCRRRCLLCSDLLWCDYNMSVDGNREEMNVSGSDFAYTVYIYTQKYFHKNISNTALFNTDHN